MRYKLTMEHPMWGRLVKEVEAKSVFDAIDNVAETLAYPEDTILIEAIPMEL